MGAAACPHLPAGPEAPEKGRHPTGQTPRRTALSSRLNTEGGGVSNRLTTDTATWRRLCIVVLGAVVRSLEDNNVDTIRTADLRAVVESLRGTG